jgi:hypothetical protein
MRVNGGTRPRYRASPARADHAAGPDRAAGAGKVQQLLADAATGRPEHVCAGGKNQRPAHGAAWRQARQIGRRAVSAGRHRPRNTGADAGGWQHAGDPTARQPRRRSLGPAEIARFKINTTLAVCIARRPSYVGAIKPLPDVYAVQRVGDRWLAFSADEWSLAAGRTLERREIDVALVPRPGPEKPAQCTNSELRRRFARSLSKVQPVDQRMRLGMRWSAFTNCGRAVAHFRGSYVP